MKKVIITQNQLKEAVLTNNNLTVAGNSLSDVQAKTSNVINAAKSAGVNGTVTGVLNSKSQTSDTLNGVTAGSECDDTTKAKVLDAGGGIGEKIEECTTKRVIENRRIEHMRKTGIRYSKSQLDEILKK